MRVAEAWSISDAENPGWNSPGWIGFVSSICFACCPVKKEPHQIIWAFLNKVTISVLKLIVKNVPGIPQIKVAKTVRKIGPMSAINFFMVFPLSFFPGFPVSSQKI